MPPFSDGSQLCAQIHVNCRPFRESTERTADSLRPWRPGRLRQFAAIFTPTRCASLSRRSKDDDNAMRNSLVSKYAVNTNHCAELITWTTEAPTTKNQQFVGHCLHHQPGKWCLWTREAEKRRHEVSMPGQVACCELVRLSRSRVVEVRATRGFTSSALPS